MSLPKSICENIAQYLLISYREDLGLYTWNTDEDRYKNIVRSASALSFTFMGEDNTAGFTINVPFRHLNLTLEPPLTNAAIQYFPCSTEGGKNAVLGRAFLQDAFLGANWERGAFWLGQAPGPNIQSRSDHVTIDSDGTTIETSSNDWEASWDGFWEVLESAEPTTSSPSSPPSASASASPSLPPPTNESMSMGTKIGIGVGAGATALLLLAGLLLWMRNRRARKTSEKVSANNSETHGYAEEMKKEAKPDWYFGDAYSSVRPELPDQSYYGNGGHAGHGGRDNRIAYELQ
ncbi:uncharacterized protein F5Z01DRAFT_690691 [Emericellopsis atlantica]|uniref:Uncharacterized protein n=1 Tax=Emericellopsis atlantica TaxID=2614577 RepID=A0A9P8CMT4_9HYPO|nr:uncharacterized protein F5Z01DRAFT_690691 [Emericellopsis atlantica]KAG9252447.1 hypothetical protein F5Z01DRAFT_690691 [Emericellopsis atlantica]